MFTPQNYPPTLETSIEIDDVDNNTPSSSQPTQTIIEVASVAVIIDNRITTPATLQIRPKTGRVALKVHKFIVISST